MYEVEYKVELTKAERDDLIALFEQKHFPHTRTTEQNDYYIEARKSPHGGYDLSRYRDEDGKMFYTEKTWEVIDGKPARKENEHEVTKEELVTETQKYSKTVKIKKQRDWFAGTMEGADVSITIDTVKFDHSPGVRYFIEAEIDTDDRSKVTETKAIIVRFLKELLGKSEIKESPGMFMMAFEKR
jgi:adenylate cyclase class IV